MAASITDSLLKNKILLLIKASNNKYLAKTSMLNTLMNQINTNDATLSDHHEILKIVLTIPMIEKYQDENMPDEKEFKEKIKQQEELIKVVDSLTPPY